MDALADIFKKSCPKCTERLVGIELEQIGLFRSEKKALNYNSQTGLPSRSLVGAGALIKELAKKLNGKIVEEVSDAPIGFEFSEGKVSLEPGSQVEFSSQPNFHLSSVIQSLDFFQKNLISISSAYGLDWIGLGVNPISPLSAIDIIPLSRYHMMTRHFETLKGLGTSMMRLTTSLQINIDYHSEEEAIEMLRTAMLLAPLSYSLFASSPFYQGSQTGYLSYRGHIWRNTDAHRTGLLSFIFMEDFSLVKYAEFIAQYPLMFIENTEQQMIPALGLSLSEAFQSKKMNIPYHFRNQMHAVRQLFSEARLKPGYIEIRSIDGLPDQLLKASLVFWVTAVGNPTVRKFILNKLIHISPEALTQWLEDSLKKGLKAKAPAFTNQTLAETIVSKVADSLDREPQLQGFLKPLVTLVENSENLASLLVKRFPTFDRNQTSALLDYLGEWK